MRAGVDFGVTVSLAGIDRKPVVAQLMQLYLHDFSAFAPLGSPHGEIDRNGLLAYDGFDGYWQIPGREPLLLEVDSQLAGFALINDWSPSGIGVDCAMAEFFVARKYRRHGVGALAAHHLIRCRPGAWEIAVANYNAPALAFWRHTLSTIKDATVSETAGDGNRWSGPIFRLQINTVVAPA